MSTLSLVSSHAGDELISDQALLRCSPAAVSLSNASDRREVMVALEVSYVPRISKLNAHQLLVRDNM